MRFYVAAVLLLFPLIIAGQDQDPGLLARIKEIEGWSSANGTWEGRYAIEAAPPELFELMQDTGEDSSNIGLRLILGDDEALVYIRWSPDGEWEKIKTDSYVIPDAIGWHVLMQKEGGVWIERWFLTFMRIKEDVADFVIVRTVHNWYVIEGQDAPVTYHVLGAGRLTRIEKS